jgi:PAS domain S-box-containing protein
LLSSDSCETPNSLEKNGNGRVVVEPNFLALGIGRMPTAPRKPPLGQKKQSFGVSGGPKALRGSGGWQTEFKKSEEHRRIFRIWSEDIMTEKSDEQHPDESTPEAHDFARLRAIFQSISGALVIEDQNRKIVLANQAFSDLFALGAPDDLVGLDCSGAAVAVAPMFDDSVDFVNRIDALLSNKEQALNDELVLKDGRVFERDFVPFFVGGNYSGHLWHYRDITERKKVSLKIQEGDAYLAAITAGALDAIVSVDENGFVQEWNAAAEDLFGWSRQEASGKALTDLFIPATHREAHSRGMARLAGGGQPRVMGQRVELEAQKKEGTIFPCELSLIKTVRGEKVRYTGFIRDISLEVARRRELAGRAEMLEEMTKSQKQQMAMISHDVRSPLHAIMARIDLALMDGFQLEEELVEGVRSAVMHIAGMLDEMLEGAKNEEAGAEEGVSTFDLAMLLRECVVEKMPPASKKGLKIIHQIPEENWWVRSSKASIRRIIENLLDNSIKYTDAGQVEASLQIKRDDRSRIVIEVRDTGQGMSADEWRNFAKPYTQADHGSTGLVLGLAIVDKLVRRLDATIVHQNVPGGGTSIQVEVPLTRLSKSKSRP